MTNDQKDASFSKNPDLIVLDGGKPQLSGVWGLFQQLKIDIAEDNEIDWNNILTDTKVFHTSGITPALNENIAQIVQKAVVIGKKKGCLVSYDLNYRSKLWSLESAKKFTESLLQYIDILFTTEEDAEKVLCIKEKCYEDVAREIKKRYSINIIAITIRDVKSVLNNDWTAIVLKDEIIYKTNIYSCEIVDRIGAGDSFTAGFLFGILKFDIQKALDIGVAFSALKHSIPGDFNLVNINEVNDLIAGGSLRIQR
jgi:2-dehydro-3-deoxygluconokinase